MMNRGRLKLDQAEEAPPMSAEEAWKQLRRARYRIPAPETMTMDVEPSEGHDDFFDEHRATDGGAEQFHGTAAVGVCGEAEGVGQRLVGFFNRLFGGRTHLRPNFKLFGCVCDPVVRDMVYALSCEEEEA